MKTKTFIYPKISRSRLRKLKSEEAQEIIKGVLSRTAQKQFRVFSRVSSSVQD
jgi:hypothetical protein